MPLSELDAGSHAVRSISSEPPSAPSTRVGHLLHRIQIRMSIASAGEFIFSALAGKDDPEASDAGAIVASAVRLFAIAVVVVTIEGGTSGRIYPNYFVHHGQGISQ
jgi:hypothetical protein